MRIDSGTVPVHHSPQQQAVSVPASSDGLPLRYGYGKSSGLTEEVQLLYHCSDCIFWLLRVAYMGLRAQMAGIDATVTVAGCFTIHSKTCLV